MPFKIRHETKGAHVHCTWFHRATNESTWQNCGTLVVSGSYFFELQRAVVNGAVPFEERKPEADNDFRV